MAARRFWPWIQGRWSSTSNRSLTGSSPRLPCRTRWRIARIADRISGEALLFPGRRPLSDPDLRGAPAAAPVRQLVRALGGHEVVHHGLPAGTRSRSGRTAKSGSTSSGSDSSSSTGSTQQAESSSRSSAMPPLPAPRLPSPSSSHDGTEDRSHDLLARRSDDLPDHLGVVERAGSEPRLRALRRTGLAPRRRRSSPVAPGLARLPDPRSLGQRPRERRHGRTARRVGGPELWIRSPQGGMAVLAPSRGDAVRQRRSRAWLPPRTP